MEHRCHYRTPQPLNDAQNFPYHSMIRISAPTISNLNGAIPKPVQSHTSCPVCSTFGSDCGSDLGYLDQSPTRAMRTPSDELNSKKNLTQCMPEPIVRTVTVSGKGQISIPQEIRKQLAVEKGSKLVVVLKDKKLLIRKASDISQSIEDGFDDMVRHSELSLKKIWDNEEDEVWNKYLKA